MGRKNRKREDDEDYVASLTVSSSAGVAAAVLPKDDVDEEAAEAEVERKADEAAARKARAEAEKREKAAVAERARAMMEARAKPRRGGKKIEAPAAVDAPRAAAAAAAVVVEEDDDDEVTEAPQGGGEEEGGPLSAFGRVLVALRPWSTEAKVGAQVGLVARVLAFLWLVLSSFADASTLAVVDAQLKLTNSDASAAIEAEMERRRTQDLWNGLRWFPRNFAVEAYGTLRLSEDGEHVERWQKNLKTRGKRETWLRCTDGEGWASAPDHQDRDDEDVPARDILFFGLVGGRCFECTAAVESAVLSKSDARDLAVADSGRPVFTLTEDHLGRVVPALLRKHADALAQGAVGDQATARPSKEKKSRADKKAKKMAYGR